MLRTSRDEQILETLVLRVRLLSLEQIAGAWWSDADSPAVFTRRRLSRLSEEGLLERSSLLAEPFLDLQAPLVAWEPGAPPPDYDAVAYSLQSRWTEPPTSTTVYVATTKARNQYGGAGRGGLRYRLQATHDLHVSAVYLRLLKADPESAAAWVGEDLRPKAGFRLKDPDAVIEYDDGRPPLVIEFGGKYDARRIRDFHEHCEKFTLRYELW
ncbi:MAG: hypothetical protein KJ749_01790 [Planctomycetes bacterium]|nr:hypothetical protein [Planctomycetota bacterium]